MLKNHARTKNIIALFDEPYVTMEETALRLAMQRRELVKLGFPIVTDGRKPKKIVFVCDESRKVSIVQRILRALRII